MIDLYEDYYFLSYPIANILKGTRAQREMKKTGTGYTER
jgi:hypothetical protein